MSGDESHNADEALSAAVVRIRGANGTIAGAGVLVTPDRVLTCAHVVSDALERPRNGEIAIGTAVLVDFPLADGDGRQDFTAEVERWIPEEPKHCGDVAVLRLPDAVPGTRPLPMADSDQLSGRTVRAVGFPDGEPGILWHRAELSGKSEGDWIQLSRADTRTARVTGGFSGSPVWDERQGAAVGIVVAAQGRQDDTQQAFAISVEALLREVPDLARALTPDPFRGLDTFQEGHEDVFFGRDDDIKKVVTALKGKHPAVILYGPSGCGKSSLALAGVVPRMRRDEEQYDALVVHAGADGSLLSGLATDLYEAVRTGRYGDPRAQSVDQVEGWLANKGLIDTLNRLRGRTGGKYLVVVDQAEALLDRTDAEIDEVARLLFPRGGHGTGSRLLVTLRSDFVDAALKHPRLGPLLRDNRTLPLTPMSRDQLRDVITKPLEKAPAVAYDPGLAQRILDDACREPENLPLLGFVLKQLWDKQFAGRLTAASYEAMHGVKGALEEHCNDAWEQCVGQHEKTAAARLLRGLVRMLPGNEAPLRRRLSREEAGEAGWDLAKAFADRRLLVLRGDEGEPETAELAHETLINVWPALRKRVRDDAEFLAGRAELDHDRDRWTKKDRSATLLPGAVQLAAIESWLEGREDELSEEERDFLARARQRRRAHRARVRAAWAAAALVLALIAGLGTFLVNQSRVSEQREAEGRSRALAVQSDELTDSNPGQAALAALAAYEIAPTQEARSTLMRRYQELRDVAWTLTGAEGPIADAAMSLDGAVTLVTTEGGRATLFVRTAEGRVRQEQLRLGANVLAPTVSRDGLRIAYVHDANGAVIWHDVTPSGKRLLGPSHKLSGALSDFSAGASGLNVKILAFSPDGRRLVGVPAVEAKRPGQVWDLQTGQPRKLPARVSGLVDVWFGPDEHTLVARRSTGSDLNQSVVAVDIDTGRMRELAKNVDIFGIGVSGDGGVVIACQEHKPDPNSVGEAHYRAVRVADGHELSRYRRGDGTSCSDVAIDEEGRHFAVLSTTGQWDLVDIRDGGKTHRFLGPDSLREVKSLPLLGTPAAPVVATRDRHTVTAWAMVRGDGDTSFSIPKLIDGGTKMVVRMGRRGDRLLVRETEGEERTLAEVKNSATTPPDATQELQVNDAEKLMADISDRNRITIRELPSLRRVTEFTTAEPPTDQDGEPQKAIDVRKPELVQFRFLDDERLITISGTRVEQWDARKGRRLSKPIDLPGLHLTSQSRPAYLVGRHREPGYLAVTVHGDPYVHAVSLRTRKENKKLRIHLGDDLNTALFLKDSNYAAVHTVGGMVELWSVPPGRSPKRVAGPLGPLNSDRWTGGGFEGSGFFLANNSSVRFLKADDPEYQEWYEFGATQGFLAASKGGEALLLSPSGGGRVSLLRLDPALWKRHLCAVLGRDLTQDERSSLPGSLPDELCAP